MEGPLKIDKIKRYKAVIKMKKRHYINKRQENLLHLSNVAPKIIWRQILTSRAKENNRISLEDWNSYLKYLYDSPNATDNIPTPLTTEKVFSLDDINFGVKCLANSKAKDIKCYKA